MNESHSYWLPLFPLNTVLFPGMPLPLHIFEERYKLMIGECARERKPFGVVLVKSGYEAGGTAEPHLVGTTARIVATERLSEGRLNIETVGETRFQVVSVMRDKPYLSAMVEDFPMSELDAPEAVSLSHRLRPWLTEYMTLLAKAAETAFDPHRLPTEPLSLAYLAAIVLQTPSASKQSLLCVPSLVELLERERSLYRNELGILKTLLHDVPAETLPFSTN